MMMDKHACTWCGRSGDEVKRLFPGPTLYVCSHCIESMSGILASEDTVLAAQVRDEIDQAVQESFHRIVKQLNFGPLQEKYQRLMHVKFKEDQGSPSFQEIFGEFKKGVETVLPTDDYQARYDLAIAYSEMGLVEDAFREMLRSLAGALRQKDFDRASEIMSALLYMHKDSARAIIGIFRAMSEAGIE
jgi:hypothetical protein